MRAILHVVFMACACCAASAPASAQTDVRTNDWSHGTTLNGFAGLATDTQSHPVTPAVGR